VIAPPPPWWVRIFAWGALALHIIIAVGLVALLAARCCLS
jgi:hypothetical protein